MRAALFLGARRVEIREIDLPEPREGQVRVRLSGCGVCASNLPVWEGRSYFQYPYRAGAPGHEGWGVIDACGKNVSGIEPGQPAALLSYNGYAQYDLAPLEQVAVLPPRLAEKPFPAEPLGCAVNVFQRCQAQAGEFAAVVGAGFLGNLLIALLSYHGCRVIAVSRRPFALAKATECGAQHTFDSEYPQRTAAAVMEVTGGRGCALVIEAVGGQKSLDLATALTAERGRLAIAGYHQDGLRHVNMQVWNWKGLDVINAHERQTEIYMEGIRRAISLVEEGIIPLGQLLTHYYPLEELSQAMQDMQERPQGFLKGCMIYE